MHLILEQRSINVSVLCVASIAHIHVHYAKYRSLCFPTVFSRQRTHVVEETIFFHPYFHVVDDIDVPLGNLRYGYKM